jgi:hypothetical protein
VQATPIFSDHGFEHISCEDALCVGPKVKDIITECCILKHCLSEKLNLLRAKINSRFS